MRILDKRIKALETAATIKDDKPWVAVIKEEGQPYREALDEYRAKFPDRVIAGDENVMWIELVAPKFDKAGNMITREKQPHHEGPSLAQVISGEVA